MGIVPPWMDFGVCRGYVGGNFRDRGKSDPSDSIARTGIASSEAICCTITMYMVVSIMDKCIFCIFVCCISNLGIQNGLPKSGSRCHQSGRMAPETYS